METKIITYGTSGYSKFIKNFYLNLKQIGIADKLKIFCLDEECYHDTQGFCIDAKVVKWKTEHNTPTKLLQYGESGYSSVMLEKLRIIQQELSQSDEIIYSDSDVFLLSNPIQYLQKLKGDCNFMLDWNGDACAGFFYARSSLMSDMIFAPSSLEGLKDFDQTLINKRLKWGGVLYNTLDARLFCNGPLWRGALSNWSGSPIAVHHNAIQPSEKIASMKRYGHWLLH